MARVEGRLPAAHLSLREVDLESGLYEERFCVGKCSREDQIREARAEELNSRHVAPRLPPDGPESHAAAHSARRARRKAPGAGLRLTTRSDAPAGRAETGPLR